jgi:FAD/FMN-containing dehydrogenase
MVIRTEFYSVDESVIVAVFDSGEAARDAADDLATLQPTILDVIDGQLFETAHSYGKKYAFTDHYEGRNINSVVFMSFNDFGDHARKRKQKQALKKLSKLETSIFTTDDYAIEELYAIREVGNIANEPIAKGESRPPVINGSSIPADRREEFIVAVNELANKHHISLPLQIQWLDGIVHTRPSLKLHEVSDKQKTFKLIADYMELVAKYGGSMCAESGEGRLKSTAAYAQLDDDELMIYEQIKAAFDPFGILNGGVKQKSDLKTLVSQLNPDYTGADFSKYTPSN